MHNPMSRRMKLADVCMQDRTIASADNQLPYLGLEQIESRTGTISYEQGSKTAGGDGTYFVYDDRHVLFSKLRPYLNKVALPKKAGRCSTELIPLLPSSCLDRSYLCYFLRSPRMLDFAIASSTGARMPRANMDVLLDTEILLPPLSEQQRIVDILDRAASIQRLRKAADDKLKEIIPALFVDMFGDPATNPKGWQVSTVGELCTLVRGSSPRPQGDKRYFGGAVPRLMIADITRDGVYVTPKIDSLTELGATKSRPMRQGSVVMAVSGAVGLPAILDIDACIHDGFVGFRDLSANIKPEFLYWYIRSQKTVAASQAVGATFQNLTTDQIKQWVVPVPPLDKQDRFVTRVLGLNSNHMLSSNATLCTEAVIRSLSYQFFG